MTRAAGVAFLLVVGVGLLAAAGRSASDSFPGRNGEIAFVEHGQVFAVRPEGTGLRRVTPDTGYKNNPVWAPNGEQIAYAAGEIHVTGSDGSGDRTITHVSGDGFAQAPAWSPDGRRIAFVENGFKHQFYVVNADGSGLRKILPASDSFESFAPSWSSDGRLIAFGRGESFIRNTDIWVVRPDGSHLRRLTGDHRSNDPSWSPNGKQLAFRSVRNGNSELYLMNADGSRQRRLTSGGGNWSPVWAPDGKQIAFVRGKYENEPTEDVSGRGSLYVLGVDGQNLRVLHRSAWALTPDWQRR